MQRRVQIFAGLAAVGRRDTKMSSNDSSVHRGRPSQLIERSCNDAEAAAYDLERAARKAGPAYLRRAQKIVDRSWKACARGHVDGADGERAENHSSGAPFDDGVVRRVGGRERRREKGLVHLVPAAPVGRRRRERK